MAETFGKNPEKNLSIGILAHVDAGKTTLSEALLYLSGKIRKLGRVDHKDAYLDTSPLERERGITIFSKQAILDLGDTRVTLLDTPGHVDFSAEMERTLQVLDYAILVINGADGVQGHTVTLWRLLERYQIPTFIFINKMDQDGADQEALLAELRKRLSENCLDFGPWISKQRFKKKQIRAAARSRTPTKFSTQKQSTGKNSGKAWLCAMSIFWKNIWKRARWARKKSLG